MKNNLLPPLLMTSEPGSFAQKTVRDRLPIILEQSWNYGSIPPDIQKELQEFKSELIFGRAKPLQELTNDRDYWNLEMQDWIGKKWDELPWLKAEAYFYRRILETTRYFQTGHLTEIDPFVHLKAQDLLDGRLVFADLYPSMKNHDSVEGFQDHLIKALWGNRGDLSLLGALDTSMETQLHHIILDQSCNAYQYLAAIQPAKIAFFFDNVGKELFFDLALIDYLFENRLAEQITGFVKSQPFFVSDVMLKDMMKSIDLLSNSQTAQIRQLARRLASRIASDRLQILKPPFLTLGREFREMPANLCEQLQDHDLTILKGDLNYRRLMGDRHWPPNTPVEMAGGYFPTPFISLRTLKSELIVGLTDEILKKVKNEGDPNWLTNGKRGIITFCNKCGKKNAE